MIDCVINDFTTSEMDKKQFDQMLEIKISDLAALILQRQSIEFEDVLQLVYESELYTILSDETTKLWHLSNEKLFDMLMSEKNEKQLTLPDYV